MNNNFPEDKSRENKSNFEKFKKNIFPKLKENIIPHLKRNIIPQLKRNIIPILTIGVAVAGSIYICKPLLTKTLIYKTIRTIKKNENPITGFEPLPLILVKEAKRVTNKAVEKTIIDHSLRDFCFQLVRQNTTTLVAILVCSALSMYAESSQYKAIKEVDKAIKNIIESKSSFDD
jgi:hypothetical protein